MPGIVKLERSRTGDRRTYLLRGLMRCRLCERKMVAATVRRHETYYRCLARSLAPGSAALAGHPRTVNVREDLLLEPINGWIGQLFDRDNVARTVRTLVASQAEVSRSGDAREAARKRLSEAEGRLRRFQAAIEAGIDPAALVEPMNQAQAPRAAARAEMKGTAAPDARTEAEAFAMIGSLGDVDAALSDARPECLGRLYRDLRLELRYEPAERAASPRCHPCAQ